MTTAGNFLAFVGLSAAAVAVTAARRLDTRTATAVVAGLALWLIYVGALSWAGIIGNTAWRPPGFVYIIAPVAIFIALWVAWSGVGGQVAMAIPLWLLIGLQTFRVGVELFLHQLWKEGVVPKMMTYEGANFDIWIGLSAPFFAFASTKGLTGLRIALMWNCVGLVALANIVGRAALTAPGPLNFLQSEVPNSAIGTFPYTFIAAFLAPLALTLHVLAMRNLSAKRRERISR